MPGRCFGPGLPNDPRPDDVRLDAFYVAEDRIEEREDD